MNDEDDIEVRQVQVGYPGDVLMNYRDNYIWVCEEIQTEIAVAKLKATLDVLDRHFKEEG